MRTASLEAGMGLPRASVNLLPFLAKDTLSCLLQTGASEMGQMGKGEEVPIGPHAFSLPATQKEDTCLPVLTGWGE